MLTRIHPSSNALLLAASRGGPENESNWTALAQSAQLLQDSAKLMLPGKEQESPWSQAATRLAAAAAEAREAVQSKNMKTLAAIATRIDASCTDCHKRYRPNVFPIEADQ